MLLTSVVRRLAQTYRMILRDHFEFSKLEWANRSATVTGTSGRTNFRVRLDFLGSPAQVQSSCTKCRQSGLCPHAMAAIVVMDDQGIAESLEETNYAPQVFDLDNAQVGNKPRPPENRWKSQLGTLAEQFRYYTPAEPAPAKFPAGREPIYVIHHDGHRYDDDILDVLVATRPMTVEPGSPPQKAGGKPGARYRGFTAGVRALGASGDPLDREIAEKVSLSARRYEYYQTRQQVRFPVSVATNFDLLSRLARSGRLYRNTEYSIHENITQLGWLCDEKFDLKFEIADHEGKALKLGLCVVSPTTTIPQRDLKTVTTNYFIDSENRLGLFRNPVARPLVESMKADKPIVVPREQAAELIEKVLGIPAGVGVEFRDVDDLKPKLIDVIPKPRIHIKAPKALAEVLEAEVLYDYDGFVISHNRKGADFFDKERGTIVRINSAFHADSAEFLKSIGIKFHQLYEGGTWSFAQKKLPQIVAQLIRAGWHVDADGKLYRTGSKFDMKVVSGIDWFELQGTAQFDESTVDLPRLLQALRSGEQTVVLDDGSIGVIPEAWIKRFGGLAEMGQTDDGTLKFSRSQVGLLDALLAEQGEVNVDEKFAAARQMIRDFERIEAMEPPEGFVGLLRPYQKLAQGWFKFLRDLGFGGCLADDMGLGKTIQVLSMLEARRQEKCGPSLIVVPRSLVFNWAAESLKFAPNLRVLDQSHSQRKKGSEHLSDFDVVLTTYGTLRRDAAFLKDFEFDYIVLDEAQAIKNPGTEAAKAARLLKGRHRLALSGTPIENHLGELWSLFDFLNPGMLGRVGRFAALASEAGVDDRKLLAAAVRPFILRRTKQQVAPELPERVEQTIVVELDPGQRKAYDELKEYYRNTLMSKIDSDGIGKSQIVILEALLRLRQAACHPGLIDKSRVAEPSAKMDELLDRLTSAAETGERSLVFSQFTSLLAIVKLRLKEAKIDFLYLDGKTKNRQALVDEFQSGTGPSVFLISLKAGGVGLNLTAARSVYLLDPWWNPAVEMQAIDRAHRIGQMQTVFATRLIAADTVEQKVIELQAKKKGLADAIINADNAGISSLTREDVERLLA